MDPYNNKRQLPIVYEETDNDPYRVVRKSPRIQDSVSDSSEFDAAHSRTASDSSTSKLYSAFINEDPYASSNYKKNKKITDKRANSYLPYSHHERDPNQKNDPIYIEETSRVNTTLDMGSLLNDNIFQINQTHNIPTETVKQDIEIAREKRQIKTYCGLRRRTILFISFILIIIIIVIWYFVWPRIPTLTIEDIDSVDSIQAITNTTKKSISSNWLVNMTVDNSKNWVPTRFRSIDMTIIDKKTKQQFGNGSISKVTLAGKKTSTLTIPMSIYYATENVNDTTFQDLYYACVFQMTSNSPFDNQNNLLNVTFSITFYIYGIIWSTTTYLPYSALSCPSN